MDDNTLNFACPSCGTILSVPIAMAGVRGPCPSCGTEIEAPSVNYTKAPILESPSNQSNVGAGSEELNLNWRAPRPSKSTSAVTSINRHGSALPAKRVDTEAKTAGIDVRRSTKDLPPRDKGRSKKRRKKHSKRRRTSVLPYVLSLVLITVFGVVLTHNTIEKILTKNTLGEVSAPLELKETNSEPTPSSEVDANKILVSEENATLSISSKNFEPAPRVDKKSPLPPAPLKSTGELVNSLVEKFLSTRDPNVRITLIEPEMPVSQIKDTILAEDLSHYESMTTFPPVANTFENFTDYPFVAIFHLANGSTQEMLFYVRNRAGKSPKILATPFFDILGGRLKRFAASPIRGEPQEFQIIIEPLPRVFEKNIPAADQKFTYRLLSSGGDYEITKAYASLRSPQAEQLYSADSTLRWGARLPCTVILQWNFKEDKENPYIELKEVKRTSW